jgi:manganese transport protein
MRLEHHAALSVTFSGILLAVFRSWELAVASLLPGIFLDVDHLVDFFAQSKERFTLRRFFEVIYRRELGRVYIVLHGWEWVCAFGVAVGALGGNPWLLGLCLGWAQHMIADQLYNGARWWSYFFLGRMAHRFDHWAAFPWPWSAGRQDEETPTGRRGSSRIDAMKSFSMNLSTETTVKAAQDVLEGKSRRGRVARWLVFMGPAFIASVAYMDPGNFATNLQGGAQYGYQLLWVVLASNLMAALIQTLSAKLGLATGYNLAEVCRMNYSWPATWITWALMEMVAMATDLAEFLGAAVGFNLLFGIPLWMAGLLTAVVTFLILGLERYGFRPLEAVISSFVGLIALAYLVETFLDRPDWLAVFYGAVTPRFEDRESVLLGAGILGATVMPHVIFLHSALTQGRIIARDPVQRRRLFRFELIDIFVAMGLAGLINAAMLIMAASTFHRSGVVSVGSLEEAHQTLAPLLGPAASWIFAVSLLASGLSSSSVGTMAGQVIMQGFLRRHVPIWIRRLVTMLPTFVVIAMGLDPTRTLVISQVALSFGLPFAVIPLIRFTRRKDIMGDLVNRSLTTRVAWIAAGLIVALNMCLLYQACRGGL